MRINKPLWHEGLILTQQHFQQQERWNDFSLRQFTNAALTQPWGALDVSVDEDALSSGRLKLTRLKLRFPDGTPIDTTVAQDLPPARDLTQGVAADRQSVTVLGQSILRARCDQSRARANAGRARVPDLSARRRARCDARTLCGTALMRFVRSELVNSSRATAMPRRTVGMRDLLRDSALLVTALTTGASEKHFATLRSECKTLVAQFDASLERRNFTVDVRTDAIVAQCALLDETALRHLHDNDKANWISEPLQVERLAHHSENVVATYHQDSNVATSSGRASASI
jgi:predicted component of type VI protein secretion system